ncbi:hypothetical protein BGZ65_008200 [Modicella reniformis]|nr:hypothetical protein BGZ65_008200 [Modicella reniformis]
MLYEGISSIRTGIQTTTPKEIIGLKQAAKDVTEFALLQFNTFSRILSGTAITELASLATAGNTGPDLQVLATYMDTKFRARNSNGPYGRGERRSF